ncbi:MAG: M20/M25/M40 family metallo-hydrolase [Myxococcota bacterium]
MAPSPLPSRLAFPARALFASTLLVACGGTPEQPARTAASAEGLDVRYAEPVGRLVTAAQAGEHSGWAWLETLCTEIGHRLSGSPGLARAVDWTATTLAGVEGVEVARQSVQVPYWVRGEESLALVAPDAATLDVIGLGGTVATPAEGVEGRVVVIGALEELETRADEIRGNVVLLNVPMPPYDEENRRAGYGAVFRVRVDGPAMAAAQGATAALVRSLTNDPTSPPHTGMTRYAEDGPRIPAAAITLPDADRIAAWVAEGQEVRVRLRTSGQDLGTAESHNVIGELAGTEAPEEIVVLGGHLDAWDVGQGCHDDASGVVSAMAALELMVRLGLRPRRTLRVIAWTAEENGGSGARAYAAEHGGASHVAGIESDIGAAPVIGLHLETDDARRERGLGQLEELRRLLAPIGVELVRPSFAGADLGPLTELGTPGIGLLHDPAHYFDLHHTRTDTLEAVDRDAFLQGVAVMAATAFVLADMPGHLGE